MQSTLESWAPQTHQLEDYSTDHFPSDIMEHAALDALLFRKLCEYLQLLIQNNGLFEDKNEGEMNVNDNIGMCTGGKNIAKGIVVHAIKITSMLGGIYH